VGTLQNSQCVLDGATSSVVAAGNNLTVKFSVRFLPAFGGIPNIFLRAQDVANNFSPWTQLGTWILTLPTPAAVSVTPNAGTATSAVFSAVYSDAAGAGKIGNVYLLVNNTTAWACGARYAQGSNGLFLINDAGTVWQGPIKPGAVGTLQNSKCVLDGATSSAVAAGNNLTVNFSLSFLPALGGNQSIFLRAQDVANNFSAWTVRGTWTLPLPTPAAASVTPNAGTATSAVLSAVYSDGAGADKIGNAYLVVNTNTAFAGGCGVRYAQGINGLFLINDAGTAWQGPIKPGAVGTLQNSKCVLDGATSSVVAAGNNLTVKFSLSFLPAFTGSKNIFLRAQDVATTLSPWTLLGTWTLP
jgi:hypothetical protein